MRLLTFLVFLLLVLKTYSQSTAVPYTLEDRDRMIRLEEKFDGLDDRFESIDAKFEAINARFEAIDVKFEAIDVKFEAIDVKFESQQRQLDDIKSLFYWGFGIMISLSLFTMGYMVWDRRTALRPVQDERRTLSEKYENLIRALKELASTDERLAQVLKKFNIL
ncbi:MAG: hypothetical protein AAGI25_15985 [Bacteroidota bacterium]